jgi:PBP1b-binding outer membrane lipoprotein LpoB
MRNPLKILLLILTLVSCKNQTETKSELKNDTAELAKEIPQMELQQTDSIAEQWNFMVFEKGGCLGGTQFVSEKKREIPTMVFSETEWKKFAENDETELTEFLITKLSDTTKTKVHTCPFFGATNGEMAVYSLQHIHNINWLEFSEFKEYKDREYENATDQPQIWLQNILKNETERNKLVELYRNELKK